MTKIGADEAATYYGMLIQSVFLSSNFGLQLKESSP